MFSLNFEAVVLLTKTSINHRLYVNLVRGEGMDLRNSNGIELMNFYFTTVPKVFFRKFSSEVEKCIMWDSFQVLPNQLSKNSFFTFEDIELRESHEKLYEKPSENRKSASAIFLGTLTDFRCILHSVGLQK